MNFPVIKPKSASWRNPPCAVVGCPDPFDLSNVIEVSVSKANDLLTPRKPDKTWTNAEFTPCKNHGGVVQEYLTSLGFSEHTMSLVPPEVVLRNQGAEIYRDIATNAKARKEQG